jgi:gas vesicle protein
MGIGKERGTMSEGSEDQLVGFVAGLLLGAAIGATAALLSAPQSGRRTRKKIGRAALEIRKSTGDRFDEVAEDVRTRVDDVLTGARKRLGSE